ncbi:Superoxide dismutase, copper/zinc binding domain protein [Metarhizium rileyi]|uniref:superoxide dismutase n=1 Tax=Metarhizium rileyi (strain RCEF 4871) TaxID=1649241 RepID=A0A167I6K1_METRR|nr:Superoxide dismutase, copper/zinc binding domain protein [Metarhizium rileyi RCEF 4871]
MRVAASLAALGAAVKFANALGAASPEAKDNPLDAVYTATLPEKPFFNAPGLKGNVKGFINAAAAPDGVGVRLTMRFENLPKTGGPFSYHIHDKKASGGNCTATGAHLDPTSRGEKPPCDASDPASCQAGDLAGKYGKITSDPFVVEYVDKYLSLKEDNAAFFGNRSFVIHLANSSRITCADFVKGEAGIPSIMLPPSSNATKSWSQTAGAAMSTGASCVCATGTGLAAKTSTAKTELSTNPTAASTAKTELSTNPTAAVNNRASSSGLVAPSPTVAISAAGRRVSAPLLWWVGSVVLMYFAHQ